jgi:hypothetical protein
VAAGLAGIASGATGGSLEGIMARAKSPAQNGNGTANLGFEAKLWLAVTDIAKSMFNRVSRNTEQSRALATLRDTLLRKLLSGAETEKDVPP